MVVADSAEKSVLAQAFGIERETYQYNYGFPSLLKLQVCCDSWKYLSK